MIQIIQANSTHINGIIKVCSNGYRATYKDLYTKEYIESVISDFYNVARVSAEVETRNRQWGGYFVAVDNERVIGAGGGGLTGEGIGEIFVLYLDPARKNEGIGTKLLHAITKQQKEIYGVKEQWVSVQKGNRMGIPFYEAKGFVLQHEQKGWYNKGQDEYKTLRYARDI
ncbi:GNAT family N-acetyltransferase [Cytobacillus sp. FSL W7-1323]|uniref:GNAT family N-acetyltransferase n=1 Tax=Cytobacillus TaxID=2675230 RepID=UPI00278220FB|nr:GNAT family N-acetyltransferase [Cytobacillus kochii]MDQ0186902.1 GNAT superfamily N-acetyltransferase [Cytobacillus kochii]